MKWAPGQDGTFDSDGAKIVGQIKILSQINEKMKKGRFWDLKSDILWAPII